MLTSSSMLASKQRIFLSPVRCAAFSASLALVLGAILAISFLPKHQLFGPTVTLPQTGGAFLLATVLSGTLGLYLYVTQPAPLSSNRHLLLLAVVLVSTVLAAKIALPGRPLWAIAFPMAIAPMLLASLLQLSLGLMGTVFLAVLVTYVYVPSTPIDTLEKVVLYVVTGTAAVIAVSKAQRLSQYFTAGGATSLLALMVVLSFWLLTPTRDVSALSWLAVAALGSGLLAAALAAGLSVILGLLFDVTTKAQLHELAQPDHPLLKQLLQEAPGTYYHSMLVGNLAEQACEVIGADALLARVGSYYHDVGKLQNPGFFIENQQRGENIHDRLDPLTSASLVIAHVRDGLRFATETRLPHQIRSFISEHHGNRLATSFYNAATHLNAKVNPELFRYPGPSPHTRESGVVMLADSVEAIARSAGVHTPEELNDLVENVVAERIAEKQLNDCDLTFRDIERIKTVFKSALHGIYHPRIQYPTPAPAEPVSLGEIAADRRRLSLADGDQRRDVR